MPTQGPGESRVPNYVMSQHLYQNIYTLKVMGGGAVEAMKGYGKEEE